MSGLSQTSKTMRRFNQLTALHLNVRLEQCQVITVEINRKDAELSMGASFVQPKQIDLEYHDVELRVSDPFVLVEAIEESSYLAAAGSFTSLSGGICAHALFFSRPLEDQRVPKTATSKTYFLCT